MVNSVDVNYRILFGGMFDLIKKMENRQYIAVRFGLKAMVVWGHPGSIPVFLGG